MDPFEWDISISAPQLDVRAEKRNIGMLALAVAAIPLFSLVGELIISLVVGFLAPSWFELNWFSTVAGSLCMYAFAMPLSYLFFRACKSAPPERERLGGLSFASLIPVCIALILAGSIIGTVVNFFLNLITGLDFSNPVQEMTDSTPLWATVLCVVILAPIMEELFFRKLVIDRLRRYGDLPAVLISGVLFGLIHGNFSQFFYAALLGIVFGFVYCRTGKLRYTVALHMIINFFGGVYASQTQKALGNPEIMDLAYMMEHLPGLLMAAGMFFVYGLAVILCIPAIFYLRRKIRLQKGEIFLTKQDRIQTVLCNPMVWVMIVVLVGRFVLFMI